MTTALRIPDRLAHTVVAAFGDVGRDWLERLPTLVADAASAWQLQVGAPFEPGGNVGWVAPVRRADGTDAVLKVECRVIAIPGRPRACNIGLVAERRDFSTPTRRITSCCSSGACPARTVMTSTSRPPTKSLRRYSPSYTQSRLLQRTSSSHSRCCWSALARRCGTGSIALSSPWIEASSLGRTSCSR